MRAIRLRHPASLDSLYSEADEPKPPRAGEIQVRLRAASINFRDGLVVNGFFPVKDGLVPLSDGAGEVTEIGEGVSDYKVGDRVISTFHPKWLDGHMERAELNNSPGGPADGFACDGVTRPGTHFTLAPKNLSFTQAASLTCAGVTAWRAVITDGRVKPGATVLIQGTGGVSLFALQFAKAAGATVIATSSTPEKLELLKAFGADHVVNYRQSDNWGEQILAMTNGLGVDHIVEVGGPYTIAQSLAAARTGAHVAIIGAVGGFDINTMPFAIVQAKRLRVQAVTVGSRRDQIEMVRGIDANRIVPIVDRVFPLAELRAAFIHLKEGRHVGKICIDI